MSIIATHGSHLWALQMFIRRKRRRLKKKYDGRADWHALDLVLTSSIRTASGPRQKIVGYIGTVEERLIEHEHIRRNFYRDALPRLEAMVPARKDYQRLVKSLHAMVPPPE